MPEAAARMRQDSMASGPRRTDRGGSIAAAFRRLRALPARGYAGAALAAVLTAIVVNALILQHERHPAPFFAARAPALEAPAPAQGAKKDDASGPAVLPPARPADLGVDAIGDVLRAEPPKDAIGEVLRADPAADAIGEVIRGQSAKDAEKQMLAAQTALIKLGYSLKADGSPSSATSTALRDFERAHSLPPSAELTPRLLKQLTAAASAPTK